MAFNLTRTAATVWGTPLRWSTRLDMSMCWNRRLPDADLSTRL